MAITKNTANEQLTLEQRLISIQSELKAPKSQYNSFGKYAYRNQEDILEALKPLLSKYQVAMNISDSIKEVFGLVYVEASVLISCNGETRTATAQAGIDPSRKGMDIAQSFGSSSSYARKYALNAMFLIDDTKDADATNNHAKDSASRTPRVAAPAAAPAPGEPAAAAAQQQQQPREPGPEPKKQRVMLGHLDEDESFEEE